MIQLNDSSRLDVFFYFSIDYDAPISEGGDLYTKKYRAFQQIIQKYTHVGKLQFTSSRENLKQLETSQSVLI